MLLKPTKKDRGNDNLEEFICDEISTRITILYKKINLSRFAEAKGISRKTLYKMRDSGTLPRDLLFSMCEKAKVNPILVEFSPNERIIYYSKLCSYIRDVDIDFLYKDAFDKFQASEKKEAVLAIKILHDLYLENAISCQLYQAKTKKILNLN